jgi:hypothetical protein
MMITKWNSESSFSKYAVLSSFEYWLNREEGKSNSTAILQEEGEDFQLELLYFRRLRNEIEDYCMYSSSRYNSYSVQASKWSDSFNVTRLDCNLLRMHEMGFVSHIRKRQ